MSRRDDSKPSLTQRLTQRSSGGGLRSKSMADGGTVYTGALASQALGAVGARAMTYEGDIFVNDNFGESAEDKALYAHERVHQEGSGAHESGDHNHDNDPEEAAAKAVERMVLHKSRAGEDFGETLKGIRAGMPRNVDEAENQIRKAMHADNEGDERNQSMMGYWSMISQGMQPHEIVQMLGEGLHEQMQAMEEDQSQRASNKNRFA